MQYCYGISYFSLHYGIKKLVPEEFLSVSSKKSVTSKKKKSMSLDKLVSYFMIYWCFT